MKQDLVVSGMVSLGILGAIAMMGQGRPTAVVVPPPQTRHDVPSTYLEVKDPPPDPVAGSETRTKPDAYPHLDDAVEPPDAGRIPVELEPYRPDPMNPSVTSVPRGVPGLVTPLPPTIYSTDQLERVPAVRRAVNPSYPGEALRDGREGSVVVEFIVDPEGNVREAHAVSSSDRVFEEAAVRAVSRWRFSPGIRGGRAVNTRMQQPVAFNLRPDE